MKFLMKKETVAAWTGSLSVSTVVAGSVPVTAGIRNHN